MRAKHHLLWNCAIVSVLLVKSVLSAAPEPATSSNNDSLPVTKVVLYKHGVGYFQRRGEIIGDATVNLHFKREQMNDLLKSLTALDLGGGKVSGIVYDSTKTADQVLGEYTFDLRRADSLGQILQQLKGSQIEFNAGAETIIGSVLGVQARTITDQQGHIQVNYLSVLDNAGQLRSFNMDDIQAVTFLDDQLNRDVQRYLKTLFGTHRRDEKTLSIESLGRGSRELLVGYVTETPVWKATYRIVLPDDADENDIFLQGWAIVDNVSAEDWTNVELSLVSGLPISFVQNLYDPHFKKRPVVQIEEEMALAPSVPQGGRAPRKKLRRAGIGGAMEASAKSAPMADMSRTVEKEERYFAEPVDLAEKMRDLQAESVARELGDMFEYRIDHPVSVDRNRSALLPIVANDVEGEAVDLYNAGTRAKNPLSAVRLRNTTGLTLEGGSLTVYQSDSYVGEALTETVKPDEQRYITYAVDLGLHVNTDHGSRTEPVYRVIINRGTMWFHRSIIETKTYNLDNKDDREKVVVIEHPFHKDWKLLGSDKPIEVTDDYKRFEVKATPKQLTKYAIQERRDTRDSIAISNITPEQLAVYISEKYLTSEARKHLKNIVAIKAEIVALDRESKSLQQERERLFQDQERLRRNLNSLRNTAEEKNLRSRYIKQLTNQETRLDDIHNRLNQLQDSRTAKQKQLDELIEDLQQDLKV